MKTQEIRQLIREEIRKVLRKQKNIQEGLFSSEPSGPLSGLVKGVDAISKRLDREQNVKKAWISMPKETLQASYDKLDSRSQTQFETLLTAALQGSTIVGILKLCKFILLNKNKFDTEVVNVCSQIAQM